MKKTQKPKRINSFFSVLLVCALLFSLASCSGSTNSGSGLPLINTPSVRDGDYATAIDNAEIGDTFIFGTYEQDNDETNGEEPIKWRILDKNEEGILLLSEYILNYTSYKYGEGTASWYYSSIRSGWNDLPIDNFEEDELKHIKWVNVTSSDNPEYGTSCGDDTLDRIFILSYDEANKYFKDDSARRATPTEYAKNSMNDSYDEAECNNWWLRTPGKDNINAMYVSTTGSIEIAGEYINTDESIGVRPAIWLTKDEQVDIFGSANLTHPEFEEAEIGDIVLFGKHDIDADTSEKDPIEWIVLGKNEGKLLLISRFIIENRRFGYSHKWEKSEVREWLNADFYKSAFNSKEKEKIQRMITSDATDDKIFLLSAEEARLFFDSDTMRIAHITDYLRSTEFKDYYGRGEWWTRSVSTATNGKGVVNVETDGNVRSAGTNPLAPEEYTYTDTGVRPVLCINLSGAEEDALNMAIFGHNSNQDLDNEPKPGGSSGSSGGGGSSSSGAKCPNCNGTGYAKFYYGDSDLQAYLEGHDPYTVGECPLCDGTGKG